MSCTLALQLKPSHWPAGGRWRITRGMLRLSAVIFDLDGTLLDTLDAIAAAANHVLEQRGRPARQAPSYLPHVGYGLNHLLEKTLETTNPAELAPAREMFTEFYAANEGPLTRVYPGIAHTLEPLQEAGIRLGVLSNKPQAATARNVAACLPHIRFDLVRGQREGAAVKPDPEPALEMARHWGLAPSAVMLVGDSEVDMQTARRAGMVPIGVSWGFRSPALLREEGAQQVIDDPEQLLELLELPARGR